MSSRKSWSVPTAVPAEEAPATFTSAAPRRAPALAPAPEPQAREAAPWPLLCPTPDCNEHLRAHPHPSAPVLFTACGHSHCGLCAAVVLREPLPQCPTCGVAVVPGQASPNTGLGAYGEAVLHSRSTLLSTVTDSFTSPACLLCAADDTDEPATHACNSGSCDNKPLCCDHSRFHAKKTGHTPVCLEGAPADAAGRGACTVHALPLSHYCMLHSEILCSKCAVTKHLSCGITYVKTAQEAAAHFSPTLSAAVSTFSESANELLHAIPAIATAKSDMASRLQASISRFSDSIEAVIAALHAHRSRVITAANLQCAEYTKALDSQAEVMSVSASQLQTAVAMAAGAISSCSPARILDAFATLNSMAALVKQYNGPVVVPVVEVQWCESDNLFEKIGELGKVVTGCGLNVASVSGLELQPGSRQEFRVVLSLEDGSAPSWLCASDVECTVDAVDSVAHVQVPVLVPGSTVCSGADDVSAGMTTTPTAQPRVKLQSVRASCDGEVVVMFDMVEDASKVLVRLSVCGVMISPVKGWQLIHQPRSVLSCAAVGTHVCTLTLTDSSTDKTKFGMAVSADEKWLIVGAFNDCTLAVYSLPDAELVRTFGGKGRGQLQFDTLFRLCFTPNGHLMVVDNGNYRLQEVTLDGAFVRFVGDNVWRSGQGGPWCVDIGRDVIAVGSCLGTGPRLTLLGFNSGSVMSRFGNIGTSSGELSSYCEGIRFTADFKHLVIVEREAMRVSLFTAGGVFVSCIAAGATPSETLSGTNNDVCLAGNGEYLVADRSNHRVCVFSAESGKLVRTWGETGTYHGAVRSSHCFRCCRRTLVCT